MRKQLWAIILVVVLVLGFPCGTFAAGNSNQYDVKAMKTVNTADLFIGTLSAWKAAGGAVQDTKTFFKNGEAIHKDDIIITNGISGIALAVGTRNPWGYPAGSVLDVGTVDHNAGALTTATGNKDMTWSIEPLVNGWDSWAPENCGVVKFELVKYNFTTNKEEADGLQAVKVTRKYNIKDRKFDIATYYSIAPGATYAYFTNVYTNTSGRDITDLSSLNRFAVTNKGDDGAAMYSMAPSGYSIGSYANSEQTEYFTGLYYADASEFKKYGGSVGYKEIRTNSQFLKNETKTYNMFIVTSNTADFTDLNELATAGKAVTTVTGTTAANGTVVVKKNDAAVAWFNADETGNFTFKVPQSDGNNAYSMYLESKGFADGAAEKIDNSGSDFQKNLTAGPAKSNIKLTVKDADGNPIFAKVEVYESADGKAYKNAYPTVRFNGDSIYYTEASKNGESTGVINFEVEPGYYKAVVYGEGYFFYSKPVVIEENTKNAGGTTPDVTVDVVYDTPEGWLGGDLHHHSNKNDAFSKPADVVKSVAASGLDLAILTDHDFTTGNAEMKALCASYGLSAFIPAEEISPSWAHFNVLPLTEDGYTRFLDKKLKNKVMNQFAQLSTFVQQTHDAGAAITANHPWYSYGLFYADDVNAIPGGYTDDYDNIEINASSSDSENVNTLVSATDLWTSYQDGTSLYKGVGGKALMTKKPHYLVGGSDTHDVLYHDFSKINEAGEYYNTRGGSGDGYWYSTGKVRTFAFVGTDVAENRSGDYLKDNALAYDKAVVNGNSYVSYGPVLSMDKHPGGMYAVNGGNAFAAKVSVATFDDDPEIYVLTKNGDADLTALPQQLFDDDGDGTKEYLQYDAKATEATSYAFNEETGLWEVSVVVPVDDKDTWVALLVIDDDGNYAITNPWWVDVL